MAEDKGNRRVSLSDTLESGIERIEAVIINMNKMSNQNTDTITPNTSFKVTLNVLTSAVIAIIIAFVTFGIGVAGLSKKSNDAYDLSIENRKVNNVQNIEIQVRNTKQDMMFNVINEMNDKLDEVIKMRNQNDK